MNSFCVPVWEVSEVPVSLDSTHGARICGQSPQIPEFGKNRIYSKR